MKGWVGLDWLVTYRNIVPPPGVEPGHVTHSSTNRARRRVTSLIRPTPLPLRHAANQKFKMRRWVWAHHELGRRFLAGGQDVDAVVREASTEAGALTAAVHPVVLERVLLQFVHQFHDVAVTQSKRVRRRLGVICSHHHHNHRHHRSRIRYLTKNIREF